MGKEYLNITDEDYELAKTDMEVFDKIYKANEGLIGHCYLKCANMIVDKEELFNSIVDGLVNAIRKYEPNKNSGFANFAMCCMLNNAKLLQTRTIRSKDVLSNKNNSSLEESVNSNFDDQTKTLIDMVSDGSFEEFDEETRKEVPDVNRLLLFLPPDKRNIFCMYVCEGKKQGEIAQMCGLSRARVWKIIQECIALLREVSKKSLDVNSLLVSNTSHERIAQMLGLDKVQEVRFFNEIYKYLYYGMDNLDKIKSLRCLGISSFKIYDDKNREIV